MKVVKAAAVVGAFGLSVCAASTVRATVHPAADFDEFKAIVTGGSLAQGDTIELTGDRYVFTEPLTIAKTSITVRGSDPTHRAVLDGDGTCRGLVYSTSILTPTLENLVFTNFYASGATEYGAAVAYPVNSRLTVRNCAFLGNRSVAQGAALCVQQYSFDGCTFAGNVILPGASLKEALGGVIYVPGGNGGGFTNCAFVANRMEVKSPNGGGGVINSTSAAIRLFGCAFTNNYCASLGGCIFGNLASASNCTFVGNSADQYGGVSANCNNSYAASLLVDCLFVSNTATLAAGVIRSHKNNKGKLSLRNCVFRGNSTKGNGGAIEMDTGYADTCVGCTFDSNVADSGDNSTATAGGAIHGTFRWTEGCLFTNNVAKGSGGAWQIYRNSTAYAAELGASVVTNCTFVDNRLTGTWGNTQVNRQPGGAAFYQGETPAKIVDCVVRGNAMRDSTRYAYTWTIYGSIICADAKSSGSEYRRMTVVDNILTNLNEGTIICHGMVGLLGKDNLVADCTFANNGNFAKNGAIGGGLTFWPDTYPSCTNRVEGSVFSNNAARVNASSGRWAPLQLARGNLSVVDCTFTDNHSLVTTGDGGAGGIVVHRHGMKDNAYAMELLVDRCRFVGNSTQHSGGAVFLGGANDWPAGKTQTNNIDFIRARFSNTLFAGNSAGQYGGAVHVSPARRAVFENCTFADNTCNTRSTGYGGAVYLDSSYLPIGGMSSVSLPAGGFTNCVFYGNARQGQPADKSGQFSCYDTLSQCGYTFIQKGPTAASDRIEDGVNHCIVKDGNPFRSDDHTEYALRKDYGSGEGLTDLVWMTDDSLDCGGKPRFAKDGTVDFGCYQFWRKPGLLLFVW